MLVVGRKLEEETCSQVEQRSPLPPISSSQSCQAEPFFPFSIKSWIVCILCITWCVCFRFDRHREVLLVQRFLFLDLIVDNCEVVRPVDKVGQVQRIVPVLRIELAHTCIHVHVHCTLPRGGIYINNDREISQRQGMHNSCLREISRSLLTAVVV